jgi:hypothetical protein
MICGIDIDALLGGLQDKLNGAKASALGMVDQLAAEAQAAAAELKTSLETQIRSWMPELPAIPPIPGIPMSVDLLSLVSTLQGFASRLSNPTLTEQEKKRVNAEISKAKTAFLDEWGDGLDKKGVSLDTLLSLLDGGDIDPCAIIPNLQKGVDGLIKSVPNMPVFPIEGALEEIKAIASESAVDVNDNITDSLESSADNVAIVAKEVVKLQTSNSKALDDAILKTQMESKSPAKAKVVEQQLKEDLVPPPKPIPLYWQEKIIVIDVSALYSGTVSSVRNHQFAPILEQSINTLNGDSGKFLNQMGNKALLSSTYTSHTIQYTGDSLGPGSTDSLNLWKLGRDIVTALKTSNSITRSISREKNKFFNENDYTFIMKTYKRIRVKTNPIGSYLLTYHIYLVVEDAVFAEFAKDTSESGN